VFTTSLLCETNLVLRGMVGARLSHEACMKFGTNVANGVCTSKFPFSRA
jgi:hypothetical protein